MNSDALRAAIAACADAHRRMFADVVGLTDQDAAGLSLLPAWTVGHVLTHLARNAEGLSRMMEAGERGEVGDMYPGGAASREADIASGAGRSAHDVLEDLRAASDRLDSVLQRAIGDDALWSGMGRTIARAISLSEVPEFRRREVEIHWVDLGLGHTFADAPNDFVRAEVGRLTGMWASRKPMGMTDLPAAALALIPSDRLAWLTGRLEVAGIEPAGVF